MKKQELPITSFTDYLNSLNNNTLPHAFLLAGREGLGKSFFA